LKPNSITRRKVSRLKRYPDGKVIHYPCLAVLFNVLTCSSGIISVALKLKFSTEEKRQ
jgi:hypothetical protein